MPVQLLFYRKIFEIYFKRCITKTGNELTMPTTFENDNVTQFYEQHEDELSRQ